MSSQAYVVQGCPVCGRRLQIRTQFIGRRVQCTHCGGSFRSRLDDRNYGTAPGELPLLNEALQADENDDEITVAGR